MHLVKQEGGGGGGGLDSKPSFASGRASVPTSTTTGAGASASAAPEEGAPAKAGILGEPGCAPAGFSFAHSASW